MKTKYSRIFLYDRTGQLCSYVRLTESVEAEVQADKAHGWEVVRVEPAPEARRETGLRKESK